MTSITHSEHNSRRRPIRGVGVIARITLKACLRHGVGADRAMLGPLHVPSGEIGKGWLS